MFARKKVKESEIGLLFADGEFQKALSPGSYRERTLFRKEKIETVDALNPILEHPNKAQIARSGRFSEEFGYVLTVKGSERALVRVDGSYQSILNPGVYVVMTTKVRPEIEVLDMKTPMIEVEDMVGFKMAYRLVERTIKFVEVSREKAYVYIESGKEPVLLSPGTYAFWVSAGNYELLVYELGETQMPVTGQELMTKDRVTLRLNAMATYRITDPLLAASVTRDENNALYVAAQLALRSIVATRTLDELLEDRNTVSDELMSDLKARAAELGIKVLEFGVRDIILPGEMKTLLNRVVEARKAAEAEMIRTKQAAEASLITRKEETAAMRSQLNTAKVLESNPTLMRLRELETLEKVVKNTNLTLIAGDSSGLAERVQKLI